MAHRDAVVVGAGPAGLGAALMLARAGADVTLVDAAPAPGGLCVTRRRDGFAYDLGGHIPFVRDDARLAWLRELLGDDLRWVDRPVSCVRDGRIVPGRYLDQRPDRPVALGEPDGSAAGELGRRFGPRFVDVAMRPYLEKIDGLPLERIPAERARRLLEDQAAPEGFHFPEGGIGRLMEAMAAAAREAGADVRMGTAVEALEVPDGAVRAVRLADGDGGTRIPTRDAVVAMPAGAAARLLAPAAPGSLTRGVPMRAVCIVVLAVDRDRLSDEPWIQVDLPGVPFSRAFEPGNWSPRMRPGGATAIGLECYCRAAPDDPVWGLPDDVLAAACARALGELGLLDDPRAARTVEVVRLPRAYPVPDIGGMEAIRAPAAWLEALGGVHLAPGSAVIEAIEAGERAAAAALGAGAESAPDSGVPHIS